MEETMINVPGVGMRYKGTVIAELRQNIKFSKDRLRRVREAAQYSKKKTSFSNEFTIIDPKSVGLFEVVAALYDENVIVVKIRRIINKKNRKEQKVELCSSC